MHIDIFINYASQDHFVCISTSSYVLFSVDFSRFQTERTQIESKIQWFDFLTFDSIRFEIKNRNRIDRFDLNLESFRDVYLDHESSRHSKQNRRTRFDESLNVKSNKYRKKFYHHQSKYQNFFKMIKYSFESFTRYFSKSIQ